MKNTIIATLLVLTFIGCQRQAKETMPSFNLLLTDNTTVLNTGHIPTGKPVMLVYFSPDCDHCQKVTEDLLKNIKALSNVQFYFLTIDPLDRLKVFNEYYGIDKYPNITLGRDYEFFFYQHFDKTGITPYLVLYDRHKDLKVLYPGGTEAKTIIEAIEKL